MRLHDLRPTPGARRARKRVGRGQGSGHGKTSCRGHKGQKSRSGGKVGPGFEGGQMPLQRRLPKRGFRSPFKKEYSLVHLGDLQRFEPGSVVDPEALRKAGLVRRGDFPVKVLSDGELMHPITLRVQKVTERARQKIVAVGGFVEEILR